jgi:FixJ family two-component response regulator
MASTDAANPEIFVVDDDPGGGDALAALLIDAGFRVTLFADGVSVLAEARAGTPACIVLDLSTPGDSGVDLLARLDARHYAAPVIVVSGRSDVPDVVEAIKHGAFDYIEKHRARETLVAHVREAIAAVTDRAAGHRTWDPPLPSFPGASSLTPREHEVLAQIVECASNKEAAVQLGISRRTVEIHRAHIMQKLGAKNSVDLMRIVFRKRDDWDDAAPRRLSA